MADDELRRLEREAQSGDPAARIEWARGLLRAGRDAQALELLGARLDDPAVRAELAHLPQWTHPEGPDRRAHLDVAPVRTPRLRWHLPDPQACAYARQDGLLGGMLGLVTARDFLAITVLDPQTGRVHATTPVGTGNGPERSGAPPLSLAGELLFVHGDEQGWVRGIHAWKDKDLYSHPLKLARDEVRAWDVTGEKPRGGEALAILPGFRHDVPYGYTVQAHGLLIGLGALHAGLRRPSMWIGDRLRLRPGRDVVYASLSTHHVNVAKHVALDRATGAPRWTGPGCVDAFDERGALVTHLREVTLRDASDGAVRWTRFLEGNSRRHVVFGPKAVVMAHGGERVGLKVLDRASGEIVGDLGAAERDAAIAGARDVVYVARAGALHALGLDGTALWTVPLEDLARELKLPDPEQAARVHSIVPAPARLYAKAWDGTVYCFESTT